MSGILRHMATAAVVAALTVVALQSENIGKWVDDQFTTPAERLTQMTAEWPRCRQMYRVAGEPAVFGCLVDGGFIATLNPCYGPPIKVPLAILEPTTDDCRNAPVPGA